MPFGTCFRWEHFQNLRKTKTERRIDVMNLLHRYRDEAFEQKRESENDQKGPKIDHICPKESILVMEQGHFFG